MVKRIFATFLALVIFTLPVAYAQTVSKQIPPGQTQITAVALQTTTPGTAQTGNANLTGTINAGTTIQAGGSTGAQLTANALTMAATSIQATNSTTTTITTHPGANATMTLSSGNPSELSLSGVGTGSNGARLRAQSVSITPAQTDAQFTSFFPCGANWNGALLFSSTRNAMRFCDGTNWRDLSPTAGRATLVAGTKTISTAAVTAASTIQLTNCAGGGTIGLPQVGTIVAGTSFVINSVQPGTASTLQAADTSVICWQLIN